MSTALTMDAAVRWRCYIAGMGAQSSEQPGETINPYRATGHGEEGYESHSPEEVRSEHVWRWRDVLILATKESPKLPGVCAVTFRPGRFVRYPVSTLSPLSIRLTFFCFLIPAVGWLAFLLLIIPFSYRQDFRLPLRISLAAALVLVELIFFLMLLAGNCLAGYGCYYQRPLYAVAGTALSMLAYLIFWGTDRLFIRTEVLDSGHAAVRGLEPRFLDLLPNLDEPNPAWQGTLRRVSGEDR